VHLLAQIDKERKINYTADNTFLCGNVLLNAKLTLSITSYLDKNFQTE